MDLSSHTPGRAVVPARQAFAPKVRAAFLAGQLHEAGRRGLGKT